MSNLYEEIVNRRTSFQKLMARVPGFRDYMDLQAQRAADRMIRDYVAGEVRKQINRLVEIERLLLRQSMEYLAETRNVKMVLQRYHDRIQAASTSGAFDRIKTTHDDGEKLYNFDEGQIRHVDLFDKALNRLSLAVSEQTDIRRMIGELKQVAVEANESFTRRETILTNLNKRCKL